MSVDIKMNENMQIYDIVAKFNVFSYLISALSDPLVNSRVAALNGVNMRRQLKT